MTNPEANAVTLRSWPRDRRFLAGSDGTVSGPRGKVIGSRDKAGYVVVSGRRPDGSRFSVGAHVIVCETFHGPRPHGMEVAHENGNPSDNRPENLAWKVPVANVADRWRHGTDWHPQRRLVEQDVREILAAPGTASAELARRYGVTVGTINHIRRGHTWRHLSASPGEGDQH
jgi:hypothetical protein